MRQTEIKPYMRYISRTSRCAEIFREDKFKAHGLSGSQHNYIMVICKNPGLYQHQLSKTLIVNKSNITRQLNALEKNGFITRRQDPSNRRQVQVFPTDRAYEVFPLVQDTLKSWNQLISEGLSPEERLQLLGLLERVYQNARLVTEGTLDEESSL